MGCLKADSFTSSLLSSSSSNIYNHRLSICSDINQQPASKTNNSLLYQNDYQDILPYTYHVTFNLLSPKDTMAPTQSKIVAEEAPLDTRQAESITSVIEVLDKHTPHTIDNSTDDMEEKWGLEAAKKAFPHSKILKNFDGRCLVDWNYKMCDEFNEKLRDEKVEWERERLLEAEKKAEGGDIGEKKKKGEAEKKGYLMRLAALSALENL